MTKPIADTRELSEVWIELDAVLVPHRELLLRKTTVRAALRRIPGPDLVRVEEVQLPLQLSAGELTQVADEVPVDIVGVFFVFGERAVGEDLADADLPELPHEDSQIVDEPTPPSDIPVGVGRAWTHDKHRSAKLVEGQLIVGRRQETVGRERRQHNHRLTY
jgi:hypothetical protein